MMAMIPTTIIIIAINNVYIMKCICTYCVYIYIMTCTYIYIIIYIMMHIFRYIDGVYTCISYINAL